MSDLFSEDLSELLCSRKLDTVENNDADGLVEGCREFLAPNHLGNDGVDRS